MKCTIVLVLLFFGSIVSVEGITKYYMDLQCGTSLYMPNLYHLYSLRLKLTSNYNYRKNMNCVFTVNTTSSQHLMFYFKDMDIEYSTSCSRDWLELHDGGSVYSSYVPGLYGKQCGFSYPSGIFHTSSNALTLLFRSDNSIQDKGFDMVITRYHTGSCYYNEHRCDNGRCIDESLTCNGNNPCGDYSDCPLVAGAIAGIVIGCIFFVAIATIAIIVCRRRRRGFVARGITVETTSSYGTPGVGYNQPVPQQYPSPAPQYPAPPPQYPAPPPAYPTGQQPPPPYPS